MKENTRNNTSIPRPIKIFFGILLSCAVLICLAIGVVFFALSTADYAYEDTSLLENISFSRQVFDRNNNLLRLTLSEDEKYRIYSELHQINPLFIQATLLYEDRYFYSHYGFNPFSLIRAFFQTYVFNQRVIGASTITMQTARLLFDIETNTIFGKLNQIWLAMQMEFHHSKEEILEAYFNLAPYGGNIEGISAASRIYFQKNVMDLTLSECLALAIVPQNPNARNPVNGSEFYTVRSEFEERWKEYYPEYRMADLTLQTYSLRNIPFEAPHLTQYLLNNFDDSTLISSADSHLQELTENIIQNYTQRGRLYGISNASAILVHAPTMEVRAYVGSADFFSEEIEGEIDGLNIRRSPGSTLKPFIYALALEQGLIHEASILLDIPNYYAEYNPENYNAEYSGPLPARNALSMSRNIPAITLANQLHSPDLYDFLIRANVAFEEDKDHYGLSLVLGGAETKATELAALYAMLLNQGLYEPLVFLKDEREAIPQPLLSKEASAVTLTMLESTHFVSSPRGLIPLRIKTGTSNGFRDAWTIGTMGEYILLVWVGNFDNSANPFFIGATAATPLFFELANSFSNTLPLTDILLQNIENSALTTIDVCAETGDVDTSLCPNGEYAQIYAIPGKTPIRDTGYLRHILVDTRTELRVCQKTLENEEFVESRIAEFWPNDMQQYFMEVGIYKEAPPPFDMESLNNPLCRPTEERGTQPIIQNPVSEITYHINEQIPYIVLSADANYDSAWVYWFVDNEYVGKTENGGILHYAPTNERIAISAVDSFGRSSSRVISISYD